MIALILNIKYISYYESKWKRVEKILALIKAVIFASRFPSLLNL